MRMRGETSTLGWEWGETSKLGWEWEEIQEIRMRMRGDK